MADSNKVGATNAGGGDPRSALRRRDQGKDDTWVVAFLKRASYGFAEKVAFSAVAMGRLLPAPEALEFSVEYAGVGWHSGRDTSSKTAKKPGRPCGCSSTSTPRT